MPAYSIDVGPDVANPSHHIALVAEDGSKMGFILCNSIGERTATSIARANLQTTPVKTSTGDSQYSDAELPFVVSAQQSYTGGLGQERFEDNRTKYHTGCRVQNVNGKMVLGPREHFTTGYQPMVISQPAPGRYQSYAGRIGRMKWTQGDDPNAISTLFTTEDAVSPDSFFLFGKAIGSNTGPDEDIDAAHIIHWEIRDDDAGGSEPGTLVDSGASKFTIYPDEIMRWMDVLEDGLPNLAATTNYWLTLYPNSNASADNHIELGFWQDPDAGTSVISSDLGTNWGAYPDSDHQLMFRIVQEDLDYTGWYFFYREQLYWISRPTTGAPTLLMNGWRGVCDANDAQLGKLLDATQTGWAGDAVVGCVVWVFAGPGSDEETPFRRVTASVSGELTCDGNWLVPHTIDTEYVVLGADVFFPIATSIPHPPTGRPAIGVGGSPPQDDQVIAYIPQGHSAGPIWMFRQYNNAGTFTTQDKSINDATGAAGNYRCKLMINVQDDTKGPILVKLEDNNASGSTGLVSETRKPGTWTEQLGWGGDEWMGDSEPSSLVSGIEYVDPRTDARVAWATSRGELFARESGEIPGLWASILLPELKAFASERTGKAVAVWNASLFLTLAGGLLEKLSGNQLIDVGPTKDKGLPLWRRGEIEALASYPGQLFVATSPPPSTGTFSTITRLTGLDSHDPIYESGPWRRITDMIVQRMPAELSFVGVNSRLWFQEGTDLMWVDLPNQGANPLTDSNYQYAAEGYVESSRIYANLDDRLKVYSSLKVVSDGLQPAVADPGGPDGTVWIDPEYEVDADNGAGSLTAVYGGRINISPSHEVYLTNYDNDAVVPVRGRYLRTRLKLNSILDTVTPVVRATLIESLLGLPNKYSFRGTVLFEDKQLDLNNNPYTDETAWEQAGKLQEYAERGEVFTLECISPTLDGAKVIVSPAEVGPLAESTDSVTTEEGVVIERLLGTLPIIQVILPDLGLI
ncbi:hypothetical protein LCGC14_0490900 [marine sediment metagenome]|uniref:Uncharacterized protein n=1 Tax=marine sediment metagenome TaxID=412755 RepID=A0A0F9SPW3_9ZZZZ